MLKILMLQKKRDSKNAQLKQLRAKSKQLRAEEEKLQEKVDNAETITEDLENEVNELNEAMTDNADAITEVLDEIEQLENEITQLEDEEEPNGSGLESDGGNRGRAPPTQMRSAGPISGSGGFKCRSRCFGSRQQRDAFYARSEVKEFLDNVRNLASATVNKSGKRSAKGGELAIPDIVLDVIRDNLDEYSKLLPVVRLRTVKGKARQHIIGDIPEGVWTEMPGILNELEFTITDVELDGYKVGGYIPVDNYLLEDSDISLGEEILFMLAQAIGYAVDKAIVYGKGANSKMPLGIVTRLAQASKPDNWDDNRGEWVDLHTSNIIQLDLAQKNGLEFFAPLLQALRKTKRKKLAGERIWLMNEATRDDLMIRSLSYNSAASIVSGMNETMPVIGGRIITLEFIPDFEIIGGYVGTYLAVERDGGNFSNSDLPLWLADKTCFKGTARYDGCPVFGECFVSVNYANTAVTTEMDFTKDAANEGNALIVTSAQGTGAGKTKLTVAGMVNSSNTLKVNVSGAPAQVFCGATAPDGADWIEFKSGTDIAAPTGSGVTVIEVQDNRILSVGYLPAVTSHA